METAEYNKDKVIHNYIYKGATVEYNARKTLRDKSLLQFVNDLPTLGNILFVNCGNGEIPLLASLTKSHVNFTAIEADEEAFLLASNCVSVPKNLVYLNNLDEVQHSVFDKMILINKEEPFDKEKLIALSKYGQIDML